MYKHACHNGIKFLPAKNKAMPISMVCLIPLPPPTPPSQCVCHVWRAVSLRSVACVDMCAVCLLIKAYCKSPIKRHSAIFMVLLPPTPVCVGVLFCVQPHPTCLCLRVCVCVIGPMREWPGSKRAPLVFLLAPILIKAITLQSGDKAQCSKTHTHTHTFNTQHCFVFAHGMGIEGRSCVLLWQCKIINSSLPRFQLNLSSYPTVPHMLPDTGRAGHLGLLKN